MRSFLLIFLFAGLSVRAADLRVATFNLMNRRAPQALFYPAWNQRADAIAAWTAATGIDVLGTQEGTREMIEDLAARLPDYAWVGSPRSENRWFGEFTAVFYRIDKFSLEKSGDFWYSETPEVPGSSSWGAANVRMATWVRLRDQQGRVFELFNSHFDHWSSQSRANSSRLLLERIGAVDVPVIALGDLNAQPGAPEIIALCAELVEARAVAPNTGFSGSYFFNRKLDHVFSTRGLTPVRFDIQEPRTGEGYGTSDHRPVIVDFEFR